MKRLTAGLVLIACLGGCSGASAPEDLDSDSSNDSTVEQEEVDEYVQNTRDIAEELCRLDGPTKTARAYGVANSDDLDEIARAYSMDSTAGPHRDAAYTGCLKGLTESSER